MTDLSKFRATIDQLSGGKTNWSALTDAAADLLTDVDDKAAAQVNAHLEAIAETIRRVGAGKLPAANARRSIGARKRLIAVAVAASEHREAARRVEAFADLADTAVAIARGFLLGLLS